MTADIEWCLQVTQSISTQDLFWRKQDEKPGEEREIAVRNRDNVARVVTVVTDGADAVPARGHRALD